MNKRASRDHWGGSAPLMLYGGGLKMGQVIGSSTKDGGEPASDPVTIPNLYATLMETVLDTGAVRAMAGIPKEVNPSSAAPHRFGNCCEVLSAALPTPEQFF